jgi:putative chitinase
VLGSTCLPPSNTNAGIAGSRLKKFGKGKGRPYGHAARVADADDTQFAILTMPVALCNRTWKLNHDKLGRAIGLGNGLLLHIEHALEPSTAYIIMPYGIRQGAFTITTRKLSDYIHDDICDYLQARTIINALDQAALIQGYAEQLEQYSERKPRHA